jgi:hypothetical protein
MFRRSALGFGALLGGFHLWLLGNQAWSGQLSEPDVVLRWTAALALACGLVALNRRGESLRSRKAVAIWVLAALLHGPALGNDLDGFATPSLPEAVATVGQVVASVSALALALLTLFIIRPWRTAGRRACLLAALAFPVRLLDAGSGLGLLPRPPPLS